MKGIFDTISSIINEHTFILHSKLIYSIGGLKMDDVVSYSKKELKLFIGFIVQ